MFRFTSRKNKSATTIKTELKEYVKGMTDKKRKAATHMLVFMISDEMRDCKSYALPVRFMPVPVMFMPVTTISDRKKRDLREELKTTMTKIGMNVVGESLCAAAAILFSHHGEKIGGTGIFCNVLEPGLIPKSQVKSRKESTKEAIAETAERLHEITHFQLPMAKI